MTELESELKATVESLVERVDELETRLDDERRARIDAEQRLEELQECIDEQGLAAARARKSIIQSVKELQSRELRKGAHIDAENVSLAEIRGGYLDPYLVGNYTTVDTDDGDRVVRVDGDGDAEADPLGRSSGSHSNVPDADHLPIQQVANLPDDVLEKEDKQVQAAVWMWNDMTGEQQYWSPGNNAGNIAMAAWKSDLTGAARERFGLSKDAARKLLSRAIENVLLPWSKGAVKRSLNKRNTDGLQYRETRLFVTKGTEIPGWKKPDSWTQSAADAAGVTSD